MILYPPGGEKSEMSTTESVVLDAMGKKLDNGSLISRVSRFDRNRLHAYVGLAHAVAGESTTEENDKTDLLFDYLPENFSAVAWCLKQSTKYKEAYVDELITIFIADEMQRAGMLNAILNADVVSSTDEDWLRMCLYEIYDKDEYAQKDDLEALYEDSVSNMKACIMKALMTDDD